MLKKMIIVSSVAAVAMLGGVGVAFAEDGSHGGGNATCTSNDTTHQSNKGQQLIGGNVTAQDLESNVLGAQATRPSGICPSVLNNNKF